MEFLENQNNPFEIFGDWYAKAQNCGLKEPTAVCLSTASKEGQPSIRMVLLKGFDERGFCFYTNLGSRKSKEITENPKAALLFYWMPLGRQIRVEGMVEPVTKQEADEYFESRHPDSRVGAWASRQSEVLASRTILEQRVKDKATELGSNPPRPEFWSGFRIIPHYFEFWEEGAYRLHNRRIYSNSKNLWKSKLLYP